jgi:hypothetical protein
LRNVDACGTAIDPSVPRSVVEGCLEP